VPGSGSGKAEAGADQFEIWQQHMKRPEQPYLTVDTSAPLETYFERCSRYLETGDV